MPFPSQLLPGSSSYLPELSQRGPRTINRVGRIDAPSSPRASAPSTPYQDDRYSNSRPISDFASSHDGSPFTPQSTFDAYLPGGHQVGGGHPATEDPFQTPPLFPEQCGSNSTGPLIASFTTIDHGSQDGADDFNAPPYPDPDGIADPMSTVNPCLIQGDMAPPLFYTQDNSMHPFPGPRFEHTTFNGDAGGFSYTMMDHLESNLDAGLSLQDPPSSDEHPSPQTQMAESPLSQPSAAPTSPPRSFSISEHNVKRRPVAVKYSYGRSLHRCTDCDETFETETRLKKHSRKVHELPYFCIFHAEGCHEQFGCKNEWVRHVRVQHIRLETWRCEIDQCGGRGSREDALPRGAKRNNDYGRKDLFLEHVRRIHKKLYHSCPEGEQRKEFLSKLQAKSRMDLRRPPSDLACPCCPSPFLGNFDAWLEHAAKGMEDKPELWRNFCERRLQAWMITEELLENKSGKWRLQGACGKRGGRQSRSHRTVEIPSDIDVEDEEILNKPAPKRIQPRRHHKQQVRHSRRQSSPASTSVNPSFANLLPSQRTSR